MEFFRVPVPADVDGAVIVEQLEALDASLGDNNRELEIELQALLPLSLQTAFLFQRWASLTENEYLSDFGPPVILSFLMFLYLGERVPLASVNEEVVRKFVAEFPEIFAQRRAFKLRVLSSLLLVLSQHGYGSHPGRLLGSVRRLDRELTREEFARKRAERRKKRLASRIEGGVGQNGTVDVH